MKYLIFKTFQFAGYRGLVTILCLFFISVFLAHAQPSKDWGWTSPSVYEQLPETTRGNWLYDVIQTSDGGYLGGGFVSRLEDMTMNVVRPSLVKLDAHRQRVWEKRYDVAASASVGGVYDLLETTDGYLAFGSTGITRNRLNGTSELYLLKVDKATGDILWTRFFGSNNLTNFAGSIEQSDSAGLCGIGYVGGGSIRPILGTGGQSTGYIISSTAVRLPHPTNLLGLRGAVLIKIDEQGNLDQDFGGSNHGWSLYGGNGPNYAIGANARVVYDAGGAAAGFILVGSRFTSTTPIVGDVFLLRTDMVGSVLWEKTFSEAGLINDNAYVDVDFPDQPLCPGATTIEDRPDERGISLEQISPGGDFVVSCEFDFKFATHSGCTGFGSNSVLEADAVLMRIGMDGDFRWAKNVGRFNGIEFFTPIEIVNDGVVISGNSATTNGIISTRFIKTDFDGNILWNIIAHGDESGAADNCTFGLSKTVDGGFVVAGNNELNGDDYFMVHVTEPHRMIRVVDQNGIEIIGSHVWIDGVTRVNTGSTTIIPPGTHFGLIVPGRDGNPDPYSHTFLSRTESFEVTNATTEVVFVWRTVTFPINIVDQHGVTIPRSRFQDNRGGAIRETGSLVTLPITDNSIYPTLVGEDQDGFTYGIWPGGSNEPGGSILRREKFEVLPTTDGLTFVWITATFAITIADQNGQNIIGSWHQFQRGGAIIPSGGEVTVPITDESIYPTMDGESKNGYDLALVPGRNGNPDLAPSTELQRGTFQEVGVDQQDVVYEWRQLICRVNVVDGSDHIIPNSSFTIPHGGTVHNGGLVHLPITDESVYPTMIGTALNGYTLTLSPGGSIAGDAVFEITNALEFNPPFVTLNNTQYGLRCIPEFGSVHGFVSADCPAANTGLPGVRIDLYLQGSGDIVATAVTDPDGNYAIDSLEAGSYTVTMVTPLGYIAASEEVAVTIAGGQNVTVDFPLTCLTVVSNPRTIGFWKHQVGVATGGKGAAQIDATTLCQYLDLIETHFNNNVTNQVVIYQAPSVGATCQQKLQVAKALLNLQGSQTMEARARQQLMALLLNVVSGKIGLLQSISTDDAVVSQAITYSDNLIDNPSGSKETAKTICDLINNGQQVTAGLIPLSTPIIYYKIGRDQSIAVIPKEFALRQGYPNPFNPTTTIGFDLPKDARVTLKVCDVLGQEAASLVDDQEYEAGTHQVEFNAGSLASGIYFYRITAQSEGKTFTSVKKMLLMK